MKKVFIVLLASAVIGIGLMATGLAMGAKTQFYYDSEGIHTGKSKSQTLSQKDTEPFEDIDINISSSKIEFIPAETYGFEIANDEGSEILYSMENGKLTVTQKSRLNFFNFGFVSFGKNYVKIYIPENASMGNVAVNNSSGSVIINKMKCARLVIDATSGNTTVNETVSPLITVKKSSGNVNMSACQTDKLDVNLTSGGFEANGINTGAMKLKLTSGSAHIDGKLLGNNEISLISGNITLRIDGGKNDYNRDISVVSGNVFIDGSRTKDDNFVNAEAKNSLNIDSTSGNVTVEFSS